MNTPTKSRDEAKAAGLTSIHRNSSGAPMGGYTPDGEPIGTKRRAWQPPLGQRAGNAQTPGLDRWKAMQPGANYRPINPYTDKTAAASGNVLNARQNLYSEMEKAGSGGITPEMRKKARSWGVTDSGFNMAAERIRDNERKTTQYPAPTVPLPPAVAPSSPLPQSVAPSPATSEIPPITNKSAAPVPPPAAAVASSAPPAPSAPASKSPFYREFTKPATANGAASYEQAAGLPAKRTYAPPPAAPVAAAGPPAPLPTVGPPAPSRSWKAAPIPPKPRLTVRFEGNEPSKPAPTNRVSEANARLKERRRNAPKFTDSKPAWYDTGIGGIMDFLYKPAI